ncbi:unnamed protein product, partial [Brassica oleracea]
MVSLTVFHVKVEVDLTLPLPPVVEFERESGEVVEVQVHYPWVPPTCAHCHELGHILRNCLSYTPLVTEKEKGKASTSNHTDPTTETTKNNQPSNSQFTPSKASRKNQKRYQPVTKVAQAESSLADSTTKEPPTPTPTFQTKSTPTPQTKSTSIITFSSPAPNHRPSLKRSRSSPILSPPSSTTANPFTESNPLFPPDTTPSLNPLPLPKPFDLNSLKLLFFFVLKYLSNHLSDPDGRIVLIWKDPLVVTPLSHSRQHLTCLITLPNLPPIYYTAIYASNQSDERADLWNELLQNHQTLNLECENWVVGGDMNHIMFPLEHSSPSVDHADYLMYQMQDCFLQAGLFDLRYLGPCHTWTNNQPDIPIAKKLDHLLVNNTTISAYPHAVASFLP